MQLLFQALGGCFALIVLIEAWKLLNLLYFKPKRLERLLRRQGFKGNPYKFLYGDLKEMSQETHKVMSKPISLEDDTKPRVITFIQKTIEKYGKESFFWQGPAPSIIVTDTALVKEVTVKHTVFSKPAPPFNPLTKTFIPGLPILERDTWAKHRKIINPAFHIEKLKLMVPVFHLSSEEVLNEWENKVSDNGWCELDVWPDLERITSDAISRTAFGSSYQEGRRIFELQKEQAEHVLAVVSKIYIPGSRFIPTTRNKRMREIESQMRPIIGDLINKRMSAIKAGEALHPNLLGLLLQSNLQEIENHGNKSFGLTIDEVIDECKVFYFGGQETTSTLLSWTLVMLSKHSDWQKRAREEVHNLFGEEIPTAEGLNQLKVVSMILFEVLRFYPPVVSLLREVHAETKLGKYTLPAGTGIVVPILLLHHDPETWGDDAMEFNPERFSEGVSKATKGPGLFFPFGWGPRICIGQNFGMLEAKMVLSLILQRFSFELSPSYTHAPRLVFTMQPQHGVHLILRKL